MEPNQKPRLPLQCRQPGAAALRLLRWTSLSAAILLIVPPAFGYCGGDVEWLNFPQLAVASNGAQYTSVTAIGYAWEGRVNIDCAGLARVKSWSLYPILHGVEGLDSLSFEPFAAGKSYPWGKRPQDVHRTAGTIFPDVWVDEYATAACNLNLERLMSQGQSRAQILSQQRVVTVGVTGYLDLDITVGDPFIQARPGREVNIICEKSPAKGVKPGVTGVTTKTEFELDNAKLTVFPDTYIGACPKDLTLFMKVQGNHAGTFEARIESTEGWQSTKVVLKTDEFDGNSGLWTKEFSDPLAVPIQKPGPGGGIEPMGGDFAPQQIPIDEPTTVPGLPNSGGGGFAPAEPGSNVHQQSLRLVATANGKTVYSSWEQYRITCDAKPAVQAATQQFLPGGSGGKPPKPGKPTPGNPTPNDPSPDNPGADSPAPSSPAPQAPGRSPKSPTLEPAGQGGQKPSGDAVNQANAQSKVRRPAPASKPPVKSQPELEATKARTADFKPDLRVRLMRRSAKDASVIEFQVENLGKAQAAKSRAQLTCAQVGGRVESWSVVVPEIPAASQRWISSSPKQARVVNNRLRGCEIRLDEGNEVKETNEGNNTFSCPECAARPASMR